MWEFILYHISYRMWQLHLHVSQASIIDNQAKKIRGVDL